MKTFKEYITEGKNDKVLKKLKKDWDLIKIKDLGDEDYTLFFDDKSFFEDFKKSGKYTIHSVSDKNMSVDISLENN